MPDEVVRTLTVDGVQYAYRRLCRPAPETEPIVLLGGVFQGLHGWHPIDTTLNEKADVITLDYLGDGTRASAQYISPAQASRAVAQAVDDLGADRINLLGYSYGSVIAHQYALRHPERIARLMLGGVPTGATPEQQPYAQAIAATIAEGDKAKVATLLVEIMLCMDPDVEVPHRDLVYRCLRRTLLRHLHSPHAMVGLQRSLNAEIAVTQDRLPSVPTLVFSGVHDTLTPVPQQRAFAESVDGCQFTVIDSADHLVILERPAEVADLALRHFTEGIGSCIRVGVRSESVP
ncbi:alpha/beta hydrolase [Streptomyces kunmingensis]|uniref:Alpha/beta hydrolase n=1 Tax=Streptomyces kunmingensis TaxID=68225 RepID=A0ABU6C824_9ACTN|nr:alpha/beta hydrolase [Streptomyces kunmingensis]MEB3960869.1 alpha/beta hydrolase [Streptomyces kunmingensis]